MKLFQYFECLNQRQKNFFGLLIRCVDLLQIELADVQDCCIVLGLISFHLLIENLDLARIERFAELCDEGGVRKLSRIRL